MKKKTSDTPEWVKLFLELCEEKKKGNSNDTPVTHPRKIDKEVKPKC